MKKRKSGSTAGFTLVELIVVIAILGILAGVGTVAYSGYVKRANKAVDQQLVADTEYAVALASVANDLGSKAGSGMLGYIILSDTNDVVATDTLEDESGNALTTTYLDDAMKAAFGEDYATTLRLKSNAWTDAATMLNEVANNEYAVSVNSSSYINNVGTEKLLGDVQGCTTALAAFMSDLNNGNTTQAYNTLRAFFGDTLDQVYADADLEAGDSTGETLANATVFCISDYVKNNQEAVVSSMATSGPAGGILGTNLMNFISDSDLLNKTATWYAAGEALVAYLDDETCTTIFNGIDMDGSKDDIVGSMNTAYNQIVNTVYADDDLLNKYGEYYSAPVTADGKTQARLDAESYVAIMSTVKNLSGDYTNPNDLGSTNLFSGTGMVNRIDTYVAAASLSDYLGEGSPLLAAIGAGGSSVAIIVLATGNGSVGTLALPADAEF